MTAIGLLIAAWSGFMTVSSPVPPGDHARVFVSRADATEQPYRLYVPRAAASAAQPLPLLVVLHGRGVDHNAWFDLTPVTRIAEQHGYLVAAPNGRGERYYENEGEHDVLDVIDEVIRLCPVDPDRVYLTGHSMGGWGAWYVGSRNAERFAAICPMAAPVPMELLERTRRLAPFIIHDTGDDVVPVQRSREAAARLAKLGISFRYREESGFGHSSRMIGANLPRILAWFHEHPRRRPGDGPAAPPAGGGPRPE
jgi:predicted peptidase